MYLPVPRPLTCSYWGIKFASILLLSVFVLGLPIAGSIVLLVLLSLLFTVISHVGIYLGNGYFTHASTSNGVIISSLDEAYYSKRYAGGGRIAVPSRSSE